MVRYIFAMAEPSRETPAEKLRIAFALIDVAERMLRQRLRRESPDISEQALDERVAAWDARRPAAEFGDGELAYNRLHGFEANRQNDQSLRTPESSRTRTNVIARERVSRLLKFEADNRIDRSGLS
jgi:hypothetical protein